jgi:hypothetical protein
MPLEHALDDLGSQRAGGCIMIHFTTGWWLESLGQLLVLLGHLSHLPIFAPAKSRKRITIFLGSIQVHSNQVFTIVHGGISMLNNEKMLRPSSSQTWLEEKSAIWIFLNVPS